MFIKGHKTWNKGKPHLSGKNNPMYGVKHDRESIEKMVMANLGTKDSLETRIKKSESHVGLQPSRWGAGFKKGGIPWNKNQTQISYFAGIVDGEGSIGISGNGKSTKHPEKKYKRVVVRISMVNGKDLLEEGKSRWGGYVVPRFRNRKNPKWSDFYEWILQHGEAEAFLRSIKPFLRLKTRQAEICLRYRTLQTRKKISEGGGGIPYITQAETIERDLLEKELLSLHLGNRVKIDTPDTIRE